MNSFSALALVLLSCSLLGFVAFGEAGGYANFHCRSEPNAKIVMECEEDCRNQHGADTGRCGNVTAGDHNCYCEGRSRTNGDCCHPKQCQMASGSKQYASDRRECGGIHQRSTLECKEMTDGFRNLCTHDCICNHGADGGHCMWDLGVCYCENWGRNPHNVGCPVKTGAEWLAIAKAYSQPTNA